MTAKCTDKPAEKREERFNAANYLTDSEILIEIADISERLTDEGVYLTDAQRQEADERRTALAKERAGRRRARSTRRDPPVVIGKDLWDSPRVREGPPDLFGLQRSGAAGARGLAPLALSMLPTLIRTIKPSTGKGPDGGDASVPSRGFDDPPKQSPSPQNPIFPGLGGCSPPYKVQRRKAKTPWHANRMSTTSSPLK